MLATMGLPVVVVGTLPARKQAALQPIKVRLDRLVFVPEMFPQ
jgi:hypothetical protein